MPRFASLLAAVISSVALLTIGTAQATSLVPGISVAPAQLNVTLGNTGSASTQVSVSNDYSVPISFSAGFQGIDEQANRLIPVGQPEAALANNLHVSQTLFTIAAHSTVVLIVTVANSPSLAPGGHYATLVLNQQQTSGTQLGLRQSISLALFVLKPGGATYNLTATGLQSNASLFRLPSQASLQFVNHGNIHVVPRAALQVRHKGQPIVVGVANQSSLPLLPGQSAVYGADLKTVTGRLWIPSHVQLIANYRPDGSSVVRTLSRSYYYIPPVYPVGLVCLIGLGVLLTVTKRRRSEHRHSKQSLENAIVQTATFQVSAEPAPEAALSVIGLTGTQVGTEPATDTQAAQSVTRKITVVCADPETTSPTVSGPQTKKPAKRRVATAKKVPAKPRSATRRKQASEKPSKKSSK